MSEPIPKKVTFEITRWPSDKDWEPREDPRWQYDIFVDGEWSAGGAAGGGGRYNWLQMLVREANYGLFAFEDLAREWWDEEL